MSTDTERMLLSSLYFSWLYDKVMPVIFLGNECHYRHLCERMYEIPFNIVHPLDENRVAKGCDLLNEFLHEVGAPAGQRDINDMLLADTSIFEVLVGLASDMDFNYDIRMPDAFALFIRNLKLSAMTDAFVDGVGQEHEIVGIGRVLTRFNNRRYTYYGSGGLFPLRHPVEDQRQVELWYQMGAYITENGMV